MKFHHRFSANFSSQTFSYAVWANEHIFESNGLSYITVNISELENCIAKFELVQILKDICALGCVLFEKVQFGQLWLQVCTELNFFSIPNNV